MTTVKTREEWGSLLKMLANLAREKYVSNAKTLLDGFDADLSEEEKTFDNLFENLKRKLHDVGIDLQMEAYTDSMKFDLVFLTASTKTILTAMKNACNDDFFNKNMKDFHLLMTLSETLISADEFELGVKLLDFILENWNKFEFVNLMYETRIFSELISGILVKIQTELYPDKKSIGDMVVLKSEVSNIDFTKTREEREAIWPYAEMKKRNPQLIEALELMLEIARLLRKAESDRNAV